MTVRSGISGRDVRRREFIGLVIGASLPFAARAELPREGYPER